MARPHSKRLLATFLTIAASSWFVAPVQADWKEHRDAGWKALQAGDLDQAEEQMKQAIVDAGKTGSDSQAARVEAFVGLSDVYLKQERVTEANILLEQSLFLMAQTPGADNRVLDRIYNNLATVRIFQKNSIEAESLLTRALVLREKRLGADHVELAEVLDRLAELAVEGKDDESALARYKRATALRESALRDRPIERIRALNQAADWYEQHGHKPDEAEALWKRVLTLEEKALGADHPEVADTLMKIAGCHLELSSTGGLAISVDPAAENLFPSEAKIDTIREQILKNFRDNEPLLVRALAIREQALGAGAPETVKVLQYLAAGYSLGNDQVRALPLYQRILIAQEKNLGPEHRDLMSPLIFLAGHAMGQHRFRDAVPLFERLASIQAAEKAKPAEDDHVLRFTLPLTANNEEEDQDPKDYAAHLRNAMRLAKLEDQPDARPTAEDLAFLKAQGWCPAAKDLSDLWALSSLAIENSRVDNAALRHVRGLVNLKRLVITPEQLSNTRPNIDDAGLVQLRYLTGLKTLNITGTAIHGTGLSALQGMNELRSLDIGSTFVDDAGLKSLPILRDLEYLQLSGTMVSDASLPVLKRLTGLKQLWLIGTRLSDEGVAELKRAIPGVEVHGPRN